MVSKVPCVFVEHLTETQKKAYILADNRMVLDAGWDEKLLAIELSELEGFGFDLGLTGFDDVELSKLFDSDKDTEDDDFNVEEESCF